jgi:hypothetical protein
VFDHPLGAIVVGYAERLDKGIVHPIEGRFLSASDRPLMISILTKGIASTSTSYLG